MSNLELVKHTEPISGFLDYLFEGLTGYTYVPILNRETNQFYQRFFAWPTERSEILDWILSNAAEKDVYIAPAIFTSKVLKRETFKESNVVWTEFDGNVPTTERLGNIPLPTLRVQSSSVGFEHWYWKLQTKITSLTEIESINRSLTYTLGADASSWDSTQILRIPGTTNHKRHAQVMVLEQQLVNLESSVFSTIERLPEPEYDFTPDTVPDVSEVVLSYSFPQGLIDLYKTKDFPVGERSSALMKLGYYLAEIGMSDAEMFSVLRNADDRWKKFAGRQDRNRRLSDLISKARIKYPATIQVAETTEDIQLFGWKSLLNSEIHVEWQIPGFLQSSGYLLLTGPSGVGKTQFSLQWAINLALGKPYLDYEIPRQHRILLMSLEMGHADIKYFMETMSQDFTEEELDILEQNIIIAPVGEPIYLDSEAGQNKLESLLQVVKPDIFMWDSVGSASTGDVSSEATVKTIMGFNDRIRNKYQVSSWFIHHNRKATADNKKPNKLSDVYGNQFLVNRATTVYCLWPSGDTIEVIPLKKRLSKMEKPWAVVRDSYDLSFEKKALVTNLGEKSDNVLEFTIKNEMITEEDLEKREEPLEPPQDESIVEPGSREGLEY